MTVIVAAVTKGGVTIAADSEITNGWGEKQYRETPKLWVADQYALGASGCLRTTQVIKHHVTWPKYRPDEDTDYETWLVKTLVPAIRTGTAGHGVVSTDSGVETLNASLVFATGERLTQISGNGCVVTPSCGRLALGSGYAEALGRLGDTGPWTEADVVDAARRATLTARGCGGPLTVVNTKALTVRTVE